MLNCSGDHSIYSCTDLQVRGDIEANLKIISYFSVKTYVVISQ